ncbi:hypothetical protein [Paraburkholderia sp. MM6662-R1]|uniref:hypothetical protein n=1 Tax=Paraburkholderia sp. MM6662-R1 TaxID=2991066 RepID=UPI003D2121CC
MDHGPDPAVPTHAVVLSALRQVRLRQVTRPRRTRLLDALHGLGLIDWIRQPLRASHHLLSARAKAHLVPDEIAQLSDAGRAALERLTALAETVDWPGLARQPLRPRPAGPVSRCADQLNSWRPPPRSDTRTDFAALRVCVQRVPPLTIPRLYFDPEAPPAASSEAIERYLKPMRADLVRLALLHGSSVLADHLEQSIRRHGSAKLTAVGLRMVEQASKPAAATPAAAHAVGLKSGRSLRSASQARASPRLASSSRPSTTAAAAGGDRCHPSVCCVRARSSRGCPERC